MYTHTSPHRTKKNIFICCVLLPKSLGEVIPFHSSKFRCRTLHCLLWTTLVMRMLTVSLAYCISKEDTTLPHVFEQVSISFDLSVLYLDRTNVILINSSLSYWQLPKSYTLIQVCRYTKFEFIRTFKKCNVFLNRRLDRDWNSQGWSVNNQELGRKA